MMAGRRWDVDLPTAIDFLRAIGNRAWIGWPWRRIGSGRLSGSIILCFRGGLYYQHIPEFVVGRPGWDNWLLWYPLSIGVPVVDVSRVVRAVHQNHDYGYHPEGEKGVWEGEEAQENYR